MRSSVLSVKPASSPLPSSPSRRLCQVAVEDHAVGRQSLALIGQHRADAARAELDLLAAAAPTQAGATGLGQAGQDLSQLMHAAAHRPYAVELDLGNEHQRGGGLPGR